jgi:hypothetical protein
LASNLFDIFSNSVGRTNKTRQVDSQSAMPHLSTCQQPSAFLEGTQTGYRILESSEAEFLISPASSHHISPHARLGTNISMFSGKLVKSVSSAQVCFKSVGESIGTRERLYLSRNTAGKLSGDRNLIIPPWIVRLLYPLSGGVKSPGRRSVADKYNAGFSESAWKTGRTRGLSRLLANNIELCERRFCPVNIVRQKFQRNR